MKFRIGFLCAVLVAAASAASAQTNGWSLGAGWSYNSAGGMTHAPGNTAPLSQSITLIAGHTYHIEVRLSAGTSCCDGQSTLTVGGTFVDTFIGRDRGPYGYDRVASDSSGVVFTPNSSFDGTLAEISVKDNTNQVLGPELLANPNFALPSGSWNVSGNSVYTTSSVGIGTSTPQAKLHVAGNVQVDGNLAARYQDVAEWVKAKHPLTPGTVVVVVPDDVNVVETSEHAYDTSVAGVVSPQPGVVLGDAGADKVLVAQSGRVRVKVDASYGAIRAGDLLVTSPRPGVAMKSTPLRIAGTTFHRPGTLLGKALESIANGEGEILVLLTLQ